MRIYFDACCLNRPFDDQTQERIHLEAEAILLVFNRIQAGDWEWIGSEVLNLEIGRTPDSYRRHRVMSLARYAQHTIVIDHEVFKRAQQLEAMGFYPFDALHLACAEKGSADVLLTTDDRFCRLALRFAGQIHTQVSNPLQWLMEVHQT